jgi:hypothetical protein
LLEPEHDRIARKPAPGLREIGRNRAVGGTETADAVGPELGRRVTRVVDQLLQFAPVRASIADELV